jgi:uncharacterized protein YnzC (UPF0291/DUF896 family)
MNQEKINRINELYHKSKGEGLTPEEKAEQTALRKEYIAAIRGDLRDNLEHISIKNPDGTITDLKKKK